MAGVEHHQRQGCRGPARDMRCCDVAMPDEARGNPGRRGEYDPGAGRRQRPTACQIPHLNDAPQHPAPRHPSTASHGAVRLRRLCGGPVDRGPHGIACEPRTFPSWFGSSTVRNGADRSLVRGGTSRTDPRAIDNPPQPGRAFDAAAIRHARARSQAFPHRTAQLPFALAPRPLPGARPGHRCRRPLTDRDRLTRIRALPVFTTGAAGPA